MYYIIGEPEYESSTWYKKIFDGLIQEKRKKRFALTLLDSVRSIASLTARDDDMIFVIGTDSEWLSDTAAVCESVFSNRVIVLGNHARRLDGRKYSIVTADIARDVSMLFAYLRSCGKTRIALYGINPHSVSDAFKKESFLSCGASDGDLFYNESSPSACFEAFSLRRSSYDGVICVNDYVAISLLRHIGESTDGLFVTSCGGSMLARFFSPSITHTRIDYGAFGKAGIELSVLLQKSRNISSVDIRLASDFIAGETTDRRPLFTLSESVRVTAERRDGSFYADTEIDEMLRIETLLSSCDNDDLTILSRVLRGATYESIAEELLLSVNGVKYKLKNMFTLCGVNSKKEFTAMLEGYIKNI